MNASLYPILPSEVFFRDMDCQLKLMFVNELMCIFENRVKCLSLNFQLVYITQLIQSLQAFSLELFLKHIQLVKIKGLIPRAYKKLLLGARLTLFAPGLMMKISKN